MKDIKDMNLEEISMLVSFADHYQTRLIKHRLRELHEQTRWIPVTERMPTEEDADELDEVLVYWNDGGITKLGLETFQEYIKGRASALSGWVIYWQRITPPEES